MDWHADMDEYVKAKSNIFAHQSPEDIAVYFADNQYSAQIAQLSPGRKITYYQTPGAYVREDGMIIAPGDVGLINKSEVKLLGEHNLQNICAALTAFWQVSQDAEAAKKVITSFRGLEHRLEFVRELNGVKYYDDSFGTTPETAIVAMKAFAQPKVLILGGSDKGIPFDKMADEVVKNNVKHAIVIGQTASKIIDLLKESGFTDITGGLTKMEDIVNTAQAIAAGGDVVLLSCGCASFGMFKDYKDRGNQFKDSVNKLQ
jgi:UDP-N-acetylmuramoylalanine--D-glutamate ligase